MIEYPIQPYHRALAEVCKKRESMGLSAKRRGLLNVEWNGMQDISGANMTGLGRGAVELQRRFDEESFRLYYL